MPDDSPLPSGSAAPAGATDDAADSDASDDAGGSTPKGPAPPQLPAFEFKPMTMFLTFLFVLGIMMIFLPSVRYGVAGAVLGPVFWPLFGFAGAYPLVTMAIAGVLEMLATALAYNWATDWIKTARFGKWSAAFRKVQMAALRSGKKDRVAALQPYNNQLTALSAEVNIAQLKGMAVTWFLVIAIYSWVYLFLYGCAVTPDSSCTVGRSAVHTVALGGSVLNLTGTVWIIPVWFVVFTFYTVPFSLLFRRILKHVTLRRHAERPAPPAEAGATGGGA